MRVLGAVLAGGQATRFGSDKALAALDGQTLLDIALATLARQCDGVCVAGRAEAPVACVPDWPAPGMGPLGGLAGAMRHAQGQGFDTVLSAPVDAPQLPGNLRAMLEPPAAYLAQLPVAGLWPVATLPTLEAILLRGSGLSMRGFAEACGARPVTIDQPIANINTPDDWARYCRGPMAQPDQPQRRDPAD